MTQDVLAQALGMSLTHVNRTLRKLKDGGLIAIDARTVTVHDRGALRRASNFDRTYLHLTGTPRWIADRLTAG